MKTETKLPRATFEVTRIEVGTGPFGRYSGQPLSDQARATGRTTSARDARARKIRRWLDYQDIVDKDIRAPEIDPLTRCKLMQAQAVAEEQVRILKGHVKPGSRNVSVRELAPGESTKRLPKSRGTASDYLADAARVLAEAERATAQSQAHDAASPPPTNGPQPA